MLDLVSVIIPVYNTEKYIQETIESVLNQTYKTIEIIAVNDGSTDQSLEILEKLKNKALNKIIIHNQKNQGQTKSRNNGVELANGKFLLFLDSDDKIDPTYIEKCVSLLNQKKTIDLVYTKTCFFDQKQGEWNLGKNEKKLFLKENPAFLSKGSMVLMSERFIFYSQKIFFLLYYNKFYTANNAIIQNTNVIIQNTETTLFSFHPDNSKW